MSVDEYVVFSVYEEEFAVPVYEVKEVIDYVKTTQLPRMKEYYKGIINLRGELIPVIDLSMRFGMFDPHVNGKHILIIETSEQITGVIVNEVKEVIELNDEDIKKVSEELINEKYIAGIVKLNNRLLVVISLKTLLEE